MLHIFYFSVCFVFIIPLLFIYHKITLYVDMDELISFCDQYD